MEITILPNFILTLTENQYLDGPKLTLIKKAAGLAPLGTKGQNETSNQAWRFFKSRGILKGSQGKPLWAWKVQGWKDLSEQYPFLHFVGHLENSGSCHVTGFEKREGGFWFYTSTNFDEKLKKLIESKDIFENLEFLPLCSPSQLISIQNKIQNLSFLIDKELEKRA